MCSHIDPRTRENPERAMLHSPQEQMWISPSVTNPDPDAKGVQGFDSEAHRAFMRSLG
jgi:hypothetical protein